jgi:hypothetical protein
LSKLHFFCKRLEDSSPDSGTFLFNRKAHLVLQSKEGWFCYGIDKGNRVKAIIHFNIHESVAQSPLRAPFGSFDFFDELSDSEFDEWLSFILNDLKEKGCVFVLIKSYPASYAPMQAAKIKRALHRNEFVLNRESTSILKVNKTAFSTKIAISKKQKLLKCLSRFTFLRNPQSDFKTIYAFIEEQRRKKGYRLSMTQQALFQAVEIFPSEFLFFTVVEETELIAAAICIQVSPQILYTFYYDHSKLYDKLSPITMLLSGIYSYALENGFLLMDLGTSSVNGVLNKSLQHFKESVGGKPSDKFIFSKSF